MTVHLIKLSVGTDSVEDLAAWQKQHLRDLRAIGRRPELVHVTRHMPKRAAEVLDGGSIYWVVQGWVVARQLVAELRPIERGGVSYCGIVLDKTLVPVQWQQRRAFQGWRYLEPKDAPVDRAAGDGDALPETLRRELAELGLL